MSPTSTATTSVTRPGTTPAASPALIRMEAATFCRITLAEAREHRETGPFFLYVHFVDPHMNYDPPAAYVPEVTRGYEGPLDGRAHTLHNMLRREKQQPSLEDREFLRALYGAEVRYLDSRLRILRDELHALGLWTEETTIVLAADHGEQFGEHGAFEHGDIHIENVHVPFILRDPSLAPRRVSSPVRLIDLAPTLLEVVALPPLAGEGRSLLPLLRGEDEPGIEVFTEREPNRWLDEVHEESDYPTRMGRLMRSGDAYLALPGGLGTLSEWTTAWCLASIDQLGGPLWAFRDPWQALHERVMELPEVAPGLGEIVKWVDEPADLQPLLADWSPGA